MNIRPISLNLYHNSLYNNNLAKSNTGTQISFGDFLDIQKNAFNPPYRELIETAENYKKEIDVHILQKEHILSGADKALSYADEILKNSEIIYQHALYLLPLAQEALDEWDNAENGISYKDGDISVEFDKEKVAVAQYRPIDDSYNIYEFDRKTMKPKTVFVGFKKNKKSETAKLKYDFQNSQLISYYSDYRKKDEAIRAKEKTDFKKGNLESYSREYACENGIISAGRFYEFKNRHLKKYQVARSIDKNNDTHILLEYIFNDRNSKQIKNLSKNIVYHNGEHISSDLSVDFKFGRIGKIIVHENNRAGEHTAFIIMNFSPYSQKLKEYYNHATIKNGKIQAVYSKKL